jgi:hypothetical protein
MKILFFLSVLFFLCGCSEIRYYPWTGDPTVHQVRGPGFAVPGMPIPVYVGSVPRAAVKIGVITVTRSSRLVNPDLAAAEEAKRHGADAVLEISDTSEELGTVSVGNAYTTQFQNGSRLTTGSAYAVPVRRRTLVALALKWIYEFPLPCDDPLNTPMSVIAPK